ncbi:hypothetical protein [Streptomyces atratus]|uniref:hypothetical protein n=1 Tax=Streptomyces atratus TaxID=1893 RepID=UPI002AC32B59|nr:hypothetical protein [Streptomyces atratus]
MTKASFETSASEGTGEDSPLAATAAAAACLLLWTRKSTIHGPDSRVRVDTSAAQGGDGVSHGLDEDVVLRVVDRATAGRLGPVEDLRVEDGGLERVAGLQVQPGWSTAPPHGPEQARAFPESEHGTVTVGSDPDAVLAQGKRPHGERGAALADPDRRLIRVLDGEVRGPIGWRATS